MERNGATKGSSGFQTHMITVQSTVHTFYPVSHCEQLLQHPELENKHGKDKGLDVWGGCRLFKSSTVVHCLQ